MGGLLITYKLITYKLITYKLISYKLITDKLIPNVTNFQQIDNLKIDTVDAREISVNPPEGIV